MRSLVGRSLKVFAGALVVHSCAGKSISHSDDDDDDDPPPIAGDDSFGGGGFSGIGGTTPGGKGGTTGVSGATMGKGGAPARGGTGAGGPTGKGGVSGRGGTTSIGGTNIGGDDSGGFGGGECGPSRTSSISQGTCSVQNLLTCLSPLAPSGGNVTRNQVVAGSGGLGGDGGSGDSGDDMASALLCFLPDCTSAYLAVDYYTAESGNPGFAYLSGSVACQGYEIGSVTFNDYARPPEGLWTTQCLAVTESDLDDSVSVVTYSPNNRVRNLRFVPSCDCPRQITRYTTCGDITSARYCQ